MSSTKLPIRKAQSLSSTKLSVERTSSIFDSFTGDVAPLKEEEPDLSEAALERIKSSHEDLLEFVAACSKVAQQGWIFDTNEMMRVSRLQGKAEYMLQHAVESNLLLMDPGGHSYGDVTCDFQVKESRLSHEYDLQALKGRVLDMFDWYQDVSVRQRYVAPYLPLIQSSGMGKTKLLYELRQHLNADPDESYTTLLILCATGELEGDMAQTYNEAVELEECMKREPDPFLKYREVEQELERLCRKHNNKPVVLLFDEAQNILVGKDNYLFNCIQWWLCKKDKQPQQVVAVFAGTTLQFADMEREPPESQQWGDYWMDGSERYAPFYQLHTMGCLLPRRRSPGPNTTEYEESFCYGRPLFAKMGQHDLLSEESQVDMDILRRLVLSHVDSWWNRVDSCFSVLATRVQMGQTSFKVATSLISRGYAILSDLDVDQKIAEICHLPDPVCARLAMCLMKEDWASDVRHLEGRSRHFWVSKMAEIFSDQTCIPSAGDEGEVFAAMYLLLCGDILRFCKENNEDCKHFSISLTKWIYLLTHGGQDLPFPEAWDMEVPDTVDASICFIQITQNYLRFQDSMEAWTQQHFLEHLYRSRSAFYVYEDCSVFDIFASIRCSSTSRVEPEYFPMLISIVSIPKFSPSEAMSAVCAMEMMLTKAKCYGGLCILLVLGRTTESEFDEDLLLTLDDLANIPNEIVSKVVEIPNDDAFDLTRQFWGITSTGTEVAEIFASHSFLAWQKQGDIESKEFLRAGKRTASNGDDKAMHYLEYLRSAIGSV